MAVYPLQIFILSWDLTLWPAAVQKKCHALANHTCILTLSLLSTFSLWYSAWFTHSINPLALTQDVCICVCVCMRTHQYFPQTENGGVRLPTRLVTSLQWPENDPCHQGWTDFLNSPISVLTMTLWLKKASSIYLSTYSGNSVSDTEKHNRLQPLQKKKFLGISYEEVSHTVYAWI